MKERIKDNRQSSYAGIEGITKENFLNPESLERIRNFLNKNFINFSTQRNSLGGLSQDKEDIIQNVLMKASGGVNSLRNESSLGSWLLSILRNEITDRARRARRLSSINQGQDVENNKTKTNNKNRYYSSISAEERLILNMDLKKIMQEVLAPIERKILTLLSQGYSYNDLVKNEDIRKELGANINTIKTAVFRARKKLKQALENKR